MILQGEDNPPELNALVGEVQEGWDEAVKLPYRVKRYGNAKARAILNVAWLAEVGQHLPKCQNERKHRCKLGSRILECGEYLCFRHYYTIAKVRLHAAHFCKVHLLCPLCAIRRGSKALRAYMDRYYALKALRGDLSVSLVTVTVRNGEDLEERMGHLKKAVKRLLHRRSHSRGKCRHKTEWSKVIAGLGSYEVTNKGKGWHPHCHIIILHQEKLNYSAMQREWERITGDSIFLNVQRGQHPESPELDFMEVTKYAVKFGDLTPEQNILAYDVLRGQRLLFSFGEFRGVKIPDDLKDEPLDNLPYIELFYHYLDGKGYEMSSLKIA